MKITIHLTYDDRKTSFGNLPLFAHREAIGIHGNTENSIYTHFYPNPGDVKSLSIAFPFDKGEYLIARVNVGENETLVNTNKTRLSILGKALVTGGIENEIDKLFEYSSDKKWKDDGLVPTRFVLAEYCWEKESFEMINCKVYRIDPSNASKKLLKSTLMTTYFGSQKAMLNLIDGDDLVDTLNSKLIAFDCHLNHDDVWLPKSISNPEEGELKSFEPLKNLGDGLQEKILKWWLNDASPLSRTPNWDFLSTCTIKGLRGLLLVEAKGHTHELSNDGKPLLNSSSPKSKANHLQIGKAIDEARNALINQFPKIDISRDTNYQLSNRIAHAWWLAKHGVPVVLLYLGFKNCEYACGKEYEIFKSDAEWQQCFQEHLNKSGASNLVNQWVYCGNEKFLLTSISL